MKKFLLIPLLCMVTMVSNAQSGVRVEKMGKSELLTALSSLGKMVFTPNNTLQVFNTANDLLLETSVEEGLAFVMTETSEAIENVNGSMVISQDRVRETIHIQGVPNGMARIISLKGDILMTQAVSGETTIYTGGLNAGIYLLQINNTTLKLIKQ